VIRQRMWYAALLALAASPVVGAAAGGGGISFGVAAPYVKVAEGGVGLNGAWERNVAVNGSEVDLGEGNVTSAGEYEAAVVRSLDGGVTWQRAEVLAHGGSVDPSGVALAWGPNPAIAGAKILHAAFGTMQTSTGGALLYDRYLGGSWTTAVAVNGAVTARDGARSIAADAAGGVHVAFVGDGGGVYYSRSADGGATWTEIATQLVPPTVNVQQASIAVDAAGDLFLAWNIAYGPGTWFMRRSANAMAWSAPVQVNDQNAGPPALAVLDTNRVYIGYWYGGPFGSSRGVNVDASTNGGASWTSHAVPSAMSNGVALAVDANGSLSFAWDTSSGVLFARSANGGATWTAPVSAGAGGSHPSLALVSGKAVVAFHQDPAMAVYATKEK
jgi:hypothetical protein